MFRILEGTVTGPQHVNCGKRREDSYSYVQEGAWTIAVVCDGCGSAKNAREGADFISSYVSKQLSMMVPDITARGPGGWIVDAIVNVFAEMREAMRRQFGEPINEYAATVVGAMLSPDGGFIVHIGDGVASSFVFSDAQSGIFLTLTAQSNPENGKSANETFYATGPNWIKHLRIEPVPKGTNFLLLCTDGAQSLLYDYHSPNNNIILLLKNIYNDGEESASESIEKFLNSNNARNISGDDKTILILISYSAWDWMDKICYISEQEEIIADSRFLSPPPAITVSEVEQPNSGHPSQNSQNTRPSFYRLSLIIAFGVGLAAGIYRPTLFQRQEPGVKWRQGLQTCRRLRINSMCPGADTWINPLCPSIRRKGSVFHVKVK